MCAKQGRINQFCGFAEFTFVGKTLTVLGQPEKESYRLLIFVFSPIWLIELRLESTIRGKKSLESAADVGKISLKFTNRIL